jgi:hypothetical protein
MKRTLISLLPMLLPILLPIPLEVAASPNGLVSYWQFDEGNGSIATDSMGTNLGTIDGASWDDGLVGGALRFDGVDDIVRLPSISDMEISLCQRGSNHLPRTVRLSRPAWGIWS